MYKSKFRSKPLHRPSQSNVNDPSPSTSQEPQPPKRKKFASISSLAVKSSTANLSTDTSQSSIATQWSSSKPYFKEILAQSGFTVQYSSGPHSLSKEQASVAKNIQEILQKGQLQENINEFMKSFQAYCQQETCLKRCLLPTESAIDAESETTSKLQKDSLIRILLTVDCLQTEVIELLLDKITDHALQENEESNWIRLLLRPLCFQPIIQKSTALVARLLDIVEASEGDSQLELISCLPDILPDSEHDDAAKHLSKLIRDRAEVTPAAVECLGHLSISSSMRDQVRNHLLTTLMRVPLNYFPILTQYLLSTCHTSDLDEVINGLRAALDFVSVNKTQEDERATSQILTFSALQLALMSSNQLGNTWMKVILSIKESNDHRPIDLVLLIILHSSATNKKKTVENIFKKRISTGHFRTTLLEKTFNKYLTIHVLKEYLTNVIEIASGLMRMRAGSLVVDFASQMYILLFTHTEASIYQRQEVIHSLVLLTGSSTALTPALNVLTSLVEDHLEILQHNSILLLNLLDRVDGLELNEVRRIMNILCALAFSTSAEGATTTIQDDLHMLIRKQLMSSKKDVQLKGVIGGVMAAKHVAALANSDNTSIASDVNFPSVQDLPDDIARQAATLINLVTTSSRGHIEATGLAYDEISAMLSSTEYLNTYFLSWLSEAVTNDFDTFIIETIPESQNGLSYSMQFCINEADEDTEIAINIGGLCAQRQFKTIALLCSDTSSVVILAPLFRLLRLIQYRRYNEDLTMVNAVLGCSIIMPIIDPDIGLKEMDLDAVKIVVDCYFYCANWFREVISAFVSQTDESLRMKVLTMVLMRLKELVQIEEQLAKFLLETPPAYRPPVCHFPIVISRDQTNILATKPATKRGRKKKTMDKDTTGALSLPSTSQAVNSTPADPTESGTVRRSCFRDFDVDILKLIRENFKITLDVSELNDKELGLIEMRFLLEDIIDKCQVILNVNCHTKVVMNTGVNSATRQLVRPLDFMTDSIRLMSVVVKHLNNISNHIQEVLESCDGIKDAPIIFQQAPTTLKQCFGLLLEYLALVFSWPGLRSTINIELLREGLRACLSPEHARLKSIGELTLQASRELTKFTECCLHISAASSLTRILQAFTTISSEPDLRKMLADLCRKFLTMRWTDLKGAEDSGAQYNLQIDFLVKTHLLDADIRSLENIISWMREEAPLLKTKSDTLQTFSSIQKGNFPILYRAVCATLAISAKINVEKNDKHLVFWRQIVTALQSLMEIVKIQEGRANFSAFLRRSLELLKLFYAKGVPILEIKLRSKPEDVVEILRIMQQSTRFLHNLCCHSRITGDPVLIGLVPSMRLTLESLIYRVKAALAANNCSSAFWMGNLRNKDIHGEEILSQTTTETTNDDEEEQLPPDDESGNDSEMDTEEILANRNSDIF